MTTNVTEGIQSCPHETSSVEAQLETLANRIDELEQEIEAKDKRINELEEELSDARQESAKDRAEIKQRVTELEARSSDETGGVNTEETTVRQSDLTPIEQLAESEEVSEVTDSPSVERAVSLFENIRDWGVKTPKGYVLRPKDNPLQLLEADRDESLAWKQYYRAAKTLERLSKGAVTFFDSDRHGKMLVLHKQSDVFGRVTNDSLSASSVSVTG